jgi:MFS family permease/predicted transcriptional regulator
MKSRTGVHLSDSMAMRLTAEATRTGATPSELIEVALDRFFESEDARLGTVAGGLSKLNDQIDRLSADLRIVNEVVAHHARFHLAITPPMTKSEQQAVSRVGSERFEEFARQVERRVERGRSLLQETMLRRTSPNNDSLTSGFARQRSVRSLDDASLEPSRHLRDKTIQTSTPNPSAQNAAATIAPLGTRSPSRSTERFVSVETTSHLRVTAIDPSMPRGAVVGSMGGPARVMRVFLPFALGYYLSYLFRTINALIAAPLTLEVGLDAGDLGLLTSVYFLTFAAAQIPIGILLDRYGPRQIQSVLLVAAAVGAALFAVADNLPLLFVGRALLGLGVAASLTAGLKALVLWFPKERLPFLNGLMVMLGGLGAVTASSPTQFLLDLIGWRQLFASLAVVTAGSAALIYLVVPSTAPTTADSGAKTVIGLKAIYSNPHFWRLAPLSATSVGTAWALQGLWASQWLADVDGLDRSAMVQHLVVMAVALSLGALLLGVLSDRLRRYGIGTEMVLGAVSLLFIATQLAIILRCPISSYVLWAAVACVGAATVLSYAILATYFPKELAGRANAALNVFHIGGAFVLQSATGIVLEQWAPTAGHYPEIAYRTAFAFNVVLQIVAWTWFLFSSIFNLSAINWKKRVTVGEEVEATAVVSLSQGRPRHNFRI